jgi:hypothetical protein
MPHRGQRFVNEADKRWQYGKVRIGPDKAIADAGERMRYLAGLAAVLFLAPASADDLRLWTVQAYDTGTEKVCDAIARGAHDRPLYEFRFRRSKDNILLIVSYDGPKVPAEDGNADILLDKEHFVLPAVAIKFDGRNAIGISISPKGFDFHDFDRTVPLSVTFGGERFEIAFKADDEVGLNMDACMRAMKIE